MKAAARVFARKLEVHMDKEERVDSGPKGGPGGAVEDSGPKGGPGGSVEEIVESETEIDEEE
ncbi:MAG TPA: hypothetical protein VHT05_07940 [Candidatus Elarobacter sp.]|nr:hypothetical protein [Candidatus Elarobacter sp.]